MESRLKITIPKPCDKDWNAMLPDTTGKFCQNCSKSVIDFTKMTEDEIEDYFLVLNGETVCGRFQSMKSNVVTLQIQNKPFTSPKYFNQLFLVALLLCMGTTLFSCTDSDGNKQKIESVEIEDESKIHVTMGVPMISETNSLQPRKANPDLENSNKDYPVKSNGKVLFRITKDSLISE